MKAVVMDQFEGPLQIREVASPRLPDDGVILDVHACGLCRSDWHAWMGHDSEVQLPHVPGHELAGVIRAVGQNVRRWQVGDRVTVPFCVGCGVCSPCREGQTQVCDHHYQPGFTGWGAFAEQVAIPHADANLVRLPESMGFVEAASLGCRFVTAYRAIVQQATLAAGQWMAVHGCGGVGLSAILIGNALGAHVMAVDVNPEALEWARSLGAEYLIPSDGTADASRAAVKQIRTLSAGGAHVSIDALGSAITCLQSIHSLRKLGTHVQIGLMIGDDRQPPIPMHRVIANELRIVGSHGMAAATYGELFERIATGQLQPGRLVNRVVSMEAIVDELPRMPLNRHVGITVMDLSDASAR